MLRQLALPLQERRRRLDCPSNQPLVLHHHANPYLTRATIPGCPDDAALRRISRLNDIVARLPDPGGIDEPSGDAHAAAHPRLSHAHDRTRWVVERSCAWIAQPATTQDTLGALRSPTPRLRPARLRVICQRPMTTWAPEPRPRPVPPNRARRDRTPQRSGRLMGTQHLAAHLRIGLSYATGRQGRCERARAPRCRRLRRSAPPSR